MGNTDDRTLSILNRTKALKKKHSKHVDTMFIFLCFIFTGGLAFIFEMLAYGGEKGYIPGLYASSLLYSNAGGYVLAGVIAFMAGVIISVLCIKYIFKSSGSIRNGKKQNNKKIHDN
jgi:hypothetical protein